MMSDVDMFIFREFFTGGTSTGIDNRRNTLALRLARELGVYNEVLELVMHRRRVHLTRCILLQRQWQTKVSRRPARGNHHDSWAIREQYVRQNGQSYGDFLPTPGAPARGSHRLTGGRAA